MIKPFAHSCLLIFVICHSSQAFAIRETETEDPQLLPTSDEWLQQKRPIFSRRDDIITWDVFRTTIGVERCSKDSEGFDDCRVYPEYSDEIKALDGKEITLRGYMFPLEESEEQGYFLIGPTPPGCPFHYHVGLPLTVEVTAKKPIRFSFEPITVKGRFDASYNKETEIFYYLRDAVLD